jgi:hypothetical protein
MMICFIVFSLPPTQKEVNLKQQQILPSNEQIMLEEQKKQYSHQLQQNLLAQQQQQQLSKNQSHQLQQQQQLQQQMQQQQQQKQLKQLEMQQQQALASTQLLKQLYNRSGELSHQQSISRSSLSHVGGVRGITGMAPSASSTTTPSMTHDNPHTSLSTFMKHQNQPTPTTNNKTQLSSSPPFLLVGNNYRGENPSLSSDANNNLSNNYSQYLTAIDKQQSGIPTQQLLSSQGLGEKRVLAAPPFGFNNILANTRDPTSTQPFNAAFAAMTTEKVVKPSSSRTPTVKQHISKMTYEEVATLAKACTTEQQILFVARQATGPPSTMNGFVKCTSTMMRLKKQKVRDYKTKQNKQSTSNTAAAAAASTGTASLSGNSVGERTGTTIEDEEANEERMKKDTFLPPLAKRMRLEMTQGLQYCNMMSDIIRSIIEDIDPENPILGISPPPVVVSESITTTIGGKPNRKASKPNK